MKRSSILRRSISLFLTMIMVFSLLTGLALQSSATPSNPVEMLTDGSFDTPATIMTDGTLPSVGFWTTMSWASVLSEPANAHTGNGLAHLVYNNPDLPANEYPTIYQDVAVETNTDYQVSFYTKRWSTSEANAPLYYGYRNALADVWTPVEQFSIETVGSEYQKISFTFNSGALTRVRIFAFVCSVNTGAFGGYHIDDFSMQKIVYDGGMIEDGSFDNAMTPLTDGTLPSVGAWTAMSWASALSEPANAHSGSGLAHLVFDSPALPANEYPTIYQDVAVTPGADYEVSFYAKKWATAEQSVPLYYGYRNALADVWTPVEQFMVENVGASYQKITFTFNAANLTTVRIFAFVCSINTGGAGGYHIDDFFMREIPEVNLLEDGSFNLAMTPITDGTLPSVGTWTSMSWASAVSELENAHSGSGLANLLYNVPGLAAGEFPTIYQDVNVEQDTIYRLTFYAKCWTPLGAPIQPLYYGLRNALTDVWTPVRQLSVDNLTNSYQKITLLFDSQQMTRVRIFAFTQSIATQELGGYHLDDFKLVKLCGEADCPHEYASTVTAPTCIEAGFTTYICTICDNIYAEPGAAALGHDYIYTDNNDGTSHTVSCSRCDLSTTENHTFVNGSCICGAAEATLKIKSASVRLDEDIDIIFTVEVPAGYTNPYMVINGQTISTSTASGGYREFVYTGITPQRMTDSISATLYATKDGVTESDAITGYSVKQYCANLLTANPENTALKTLLSDLLTYGAAAQTYTNYKTNDLATAGLTLTPSTFSEISGKAVSFTGTADPGTFWTEATLVLGNTVGMRFYFVTDAQLSIDVTINGSTETFDSGFVACGNGKYYLDVPGIQATDFDTTVTAEFYDNGVKIGSTLNYTVNAYICGTQNSANSALQALVRALYNYGVSAAAYQ